MPTAGKSIIAGLKDAIAYNAECNMRMTQEQFKLYMNSRDSIDTGEKLRKKIEKAARDIGYLVYHTTNSKRSPSGFPDTVLCRPPYNLTFIEFKGPHESASPEQLAWVRALSDVTVPPQAYIAEPKDYMDILRLLAGRR